MDLSTIEKLVKEGEGPCLEFKVEFPRQARDMAKEMAALANTQGGIILVGVSDDGDLIGVSDPDNVMNRIAGVARNSCRPPLSVEIDKSPVGEGKYIVWVKIQAGETLSLVEDKCYIRVGSASEPVQNGDELKRHMKLDYMPSRSSDGPSPRVLAVPPLAKGFKGRADELQRLTSYLLSETVSVVIIEGISGVGKTTLAAYFASMLTDYEYRAFWIDCREDTSVDSICWYLATFARSNGDHNLADIIEDVNRPQEERLTNIAVALARCKYILFLDDYQFVVNPNVNRFIQKIEQRSGLTKVFLISRIRPDVATLISPLATREEHLQSGLDPDSCTQLLSECGLRVDAGTAKKIWNIAGGGHPRALLIFVARARSYPVAQLLSSLPVFRDELKQEWLTPLLNELPEDLQEIVVDLAVFDRPFPYQATRKLYPEMNVDPLILSLIDRFIVDQVDEGFLSMHTLIREHCYSLIDDATAKHRWAAEYYLEEIGAVADPEMMTEAQIEACLAAWSHLIKAGEHERAVGVVDKLRKTLMNQGQYERLMFLLEHTILPTEEDEIWFRINEARIFSLWGDTDYAIRLLQPLVQASSTRFAREAVLVLALVYCEHDNPAEAIALLESYKHYFLESASPRSVQRFLSRLVWAHRLIGELDRSLEWAKQICDVCEQQGDEIGGAIALRNMAAIFQAQGALQPALAFCQRSFELSTEHNRLRDGALSEMALGTIYEELENYSSALNCFGGALSKFIRMGDRKNAGDCRKRLMGVQVKLESK